MYDQPINNVNIYIFIDIYIYTYIQDKTLQKGIVRLRIYILYLLVNTCNLSSEAGNMKRNIVIKKTQRKSFTTCIIRSSQEQMVKTHLYLNHVKFIY